MQYLTPAVFCAFLCAHVSSRTSPIEINSAPAIRNSEGVKSALGKVFEAKQCGGLGKFIEWRVEGCSTTDIPCQLAADGSRRLSELDFVTNQTAEELGLEITVQFPDEEPFSIFNEVIPGSAVTANTFHTVGIAGSINEEAKGSMVTVRMMVYNVAANTTEVCAEAAYEFI